MADDDSPNDDSPNDDYPNDDSPNDDSPNDDSPNDDDPTHSINKEHAVIIPLEQVTEDASHALEDVLISPRHLHLPGFQEVEKLALLLIKLADDTDRHIVPAELCRKIATAAGSLHDLDKSSNNFIRQYESKWGYTLFGRCLGPESLQKSAAQKTKFGWMRYAQAEQITEES